MTFKEFKKSEIYNYFGDEPILRYAFEKDDSIDGRIDTNRENVDDYEIAYIGIDIADGYPKPAIILKQQNEMIYEGMTYKQFVKSKISNLMPNGYDVKDYDTDKYLDSSVDLDEYKVMSIGGGDYSEDFAPVIYVLKK